MKNTSLPLAPVIVWFRKDLRLSDNPTLAAAVRMRTPVIPVFIWSPEEEEPWPPGAASRWWLHYSLEKLAHSLNSIDSKLILRRGPALNVLPRLVRETGASTVIWNRRYEPAVTARDAALEGVLQKHGVHTETFGAGLLFEPWTVKSKSTQKPLQVFTAFWKTCLRAPEPAPSSLRAPGRLLPPREWPESLPLEKLALLPRIDWAEGLREAWTPGEAGARAALDQFARTALDNYPHDRDYPAIEGTSRLSPHLHFGEISPHTVWGAIHQHRNSINAAAADVYLKELGWREFAHHVLYHFPHTSNQPLRPEFAAFPWRKSSALLKKWQRGLTGYPLVDAGMRQLWATGWMHNRVRMVVASFLTKQLRIDWEEGAYWFWDTLVDADLANNSLNWQWNAGSGADAAPYFRIFNPVRQSQRFDAEGRYIHRWVPELRNLPAPFLHAPWAAPAEALSKAGVRLGHNYPRPVVELEKAREEALQAFRSIRRRA